MWKHDPVAGSGRRRQELRPHIGVGVCLPRYVTPGLEGGGDAGESSALSPSLRDVSGPQSTQQDHQQEDPLESNLRPSFYGKC